MSVVAVLPVDTLEGLLRQQGQLRVSMLRGQVGRCVRDFSLWTRLTAFKQAWERVLARLDAGEKAVDALKAERAVVCRALDAEADGWAQAAARLGLIDFSEDISRMDGWHASLEQAGEWYVFRVSPVEGDGVHPLDGCVARSYEQARAVLFVWGLITAKEYGINER
jgi:hypothetical protein